MKTVYLTIIGLLISVLSFSQLSVNKVTSELAIDGLLEESFWDVSNPMIIGYSNNTANFGLLWDDNYLYIGVEVQDATLCTNKRQGFYDDGIEICIDGNNNQGSSFDSFDRIFIKPIRSYWIQEMAQNYTGVIHNYIETPTGYTMEFAIPWTNINISPSVATDIGFNIVVNDDENCSSPQNSPSQLIWAGSSSYYSSPSDWGTISLLSETVTYSADYIALTSPNGGEFCINSKITDINWVSYGITNVDLDYSTDNGSTWNSLGTNILASSGLYNWDVSATPSDSCLIRISETGNLTLNDISESVFTISAPLIAVEPLIPNTWKNYQWPYNAYFPEDEEGINGHVGSACGHASLARIMHYWEFPIVGNDALNFTDYSGYTWTVNFGETTYNYDNMPNYLPTSSSEEEYTDVATLTYHAATSMNDFYASGGDLANMSYAMSHYFNYKESIPTIRTGYTKAEWMTILINELDNGRVLLIDGMTPEVLGDWHDNNWVAGHWFHIDGYNEDGHFHGVLGYGNEDAWFDIDQIFDYSLNNGVLVGLEPNLDEKELSLQTHNGGEIIQAEEVIQINWISESISNIRIEYTIDNGQNWEEIITSISAELGTYDWTVPNISSNECKIKLTDTENVNVYDKSNAAFSVTLYELELGSPVGGEYFISGDLNQITWANTPVENIKIDFSSDNGSIWTELTANSPASSGSFAWTVPNISSNLCLIKITDISNTEIFDVSESTFEIGQANNNGGPYVSDDNTILLLHFNNNLNEESHEYTLSNQGIEKTYIPNPISGLSEAIHFDNSIAGNQSYVTVPNSAGEMSLTGNWTIEFWFKFNSWDDSYNNWATPILLPTTGFDANYYLEIPASWGCLKYGFANSSGGAQILSSSNSITIGDWYHVALINDSDNSTIKLMLHDSNFDLLEEQSGNYTAGTLSTGTQDLRIGAGLFTENHFDGYMDELRISNIVRSFDATPTANFSANTVIGINPLEVDFTDSSSPGELAINQWNWDFDNDGTVDSYDQNPTWTYNDVGIYTVSLTVGDGTNQNTQTKTDYINVIDENSDIRMLLRSNSYFEVWGLYTEQAAADTIISVLTTNYDRIADSLNTQLTEKVIVDVYPDLTTYHIAIGWPDAPDWVVGTAMGSDKIDMVSPYNPGPVHNFASIIDVIAHELVHCFVNKLADGALMSTWLNEGTAAYLSYQSVNTDYICSYINQNNGEIPTLDELNNGSTFGNIGGYSFSYTIVEFIVTQLGGSDVLSEFIASGLDYTLLGSQNELAFQNEWHQYIYLNFQCSFSEIHAVFLADIVSGEGPLEVEFTDYSVQGSTGINSWIWDFENDGIIDSYEQNPQWTYNEDGTYSVSLTVGNSNISNTYVKTDYITVTDSDVSINDNITKNQLVSIYPNPANAIVNISFDGDFSFSILSITGQKIIDKEATNTIALDISSFDKGIYFISIKHANGKTRKKLIIQ